MVRNICIRFNRGQPSRTTPKIFQVTPSADLLKTMESHQLDIRKAASFVHNSFLTALSPRLPKFWLSHQDSFPLAHRLTGLTSRKTNTLLFMDQLPAEIQLNILRFVPDVPALLAAISASPRLLHLYHQQRDQIFVAVVCNQIGRDLSNAIHLLNTEGHPKNHARNADHLTTHEAKELLEQDAIVNRLIHECITSQLGHDFQLSHLDSFRMQRGMYNFLHAASIARMQAAKEQKHQLYKAFCGSLTTVEIFETLYVLRCLHELAIRHFEALSDYLYHNIIEGFIESDLNDTDGCFGASSETVEEWIDYAPWALNLNKLMHLTDPVDDLEFYTFNQDFATRGFGAYSYADDDYDDMLRNQIPMNHGFPEEEIEDLNQRHELILQECYRKVVTTGWPTYSRYGPLPALRARDIEDEICDLKEQRFRSLRGTVERKLRDWFRENYNLSWPHDVLPGHEYSYSHRRYTCGLPASVREYIAARTGNVVFV